MNSESPWAESAQHFQQIFGQSWAQALESFQKLDTGAKTPAPAPLKLSQTKLQALQQQYQLYGGDLKKFMARLPAPAAGAASAPPSAPAVTASAAAPAEAASR